jgi:iron complex outermembrane receptor protein
VKTKLGMRGPALLGLVAPLVVAFPQQSFALEDSIEEIVTTGTRARARSVEDSPAPVDVLSAEYFANQGVRTWCEILCPRTT